MNISAAVLFLFNCAVFFVYGRDKQFARRHAYRVPERVLLALAFFGGSPGALMGMLVFHHKTRKAKFMVLVPLFLILHLLAGILLYYLVPGTVF